jgi:hypothetical protein
MGPTALHILRIKVCCGFISPLKIHRPRLGLNPQTLGPMESTLTTRPVVFNRVRGYVDYTICITCIMYQQLWGYKVEDKLYLGVREQKRLNTTALDD